MNLNELYQNYFIGFDFEIYNDSLHNTSSVSAYLRYGMGDKLRFYPEMLTSIIPRIFKKPRGISEAQYLDKLYAHRFKHNVVVSGYPEFIG